MQAGHKNTYDCIKSFSETDFTEDLKKFDIPTLIVHGDDDQIVPISAAALRSAKLVKNAMLKIYAGAPHGLGYTHKDQLNADLLAFLKTRGRFAGGAWQESCPMDRRLILVQTLSTIMVSIEKYSKGLGAREEGR